jgi:hypothetical protein
MGVSSTHLFQKSEHPLHTASFRSLLSLTIYRPQTPGAKDLIDGIADWYLYSTLESALAFFPPFILIPGAVNDGLS